MEAFSSNPVTRRSALKTGLIFSSAFLTAGWQSRLHAAGPRTDFGKKGMHFLAVGDYGTGKGGQVKVAQRMNEFAGKLDAPLTAVLALGDNFYNMLEPARFDRHFERMYSKEHLDCPFYACLGNHDYGPDYDSKQGRVKADMQLDYARNNPTSRWKMPAKWYAVEFPSPAAPLVKIIYLDGNYALGALTPQERLDQNRWLKAEMKKPTRARWTWVISHFPLFTDDKKRKDNQGLIKDWGEHLKGNDVSLYLAGHDHNLQHLQIKDYKPCFLVSGGGGASTYETEKSERGFSKEVFGFNHIHVDDERITVQLLDMDGNCMHAFERSRAGRVKVRKA
ncbi:metallophosphoesterase [Luteolibacter rhizosphaerae]|uniref:metallophosphoesterase n=1 Tax=Luteolibacter rhizosphaerae TaxID=2989719 RepID=UPI0022237977|nr:metallophosphoesterase [Luteolibacter rhizosphaerae]